MTAPMVVEYQSWSGDPHESDAGAVHRAITKVACDLGRADRLAADQPWAETFNAEMAADARHLAYFVVSTIAERDVCDLDAAISEGRNDRRIGETPEMSYRRVLRAYVDLPD
jgi:hypothetical protein